MTEEPGQLVVRAAPAGGWLVEFAVQGGEVVHLFGPVPHAEAEAFAAGWVAAARRLVRQPSVPASRRN